MKLSNPKLLVSGALMLALLATHATANSPASSQPLTNAKGSRIVGVWDVNVDLYNCDTDAFIFSFPAMHKFELGGTGQVVPAGNSPVAPVHFMVWEYLGDDTWSSVFKFYRYDAGGLIGTTVLTNQVWISEDGMEYGGSGISELYDLAGNRVGVAGCPTISGTRFTGAP